MTTTLYIRLAGRRPYHLLDDDGASAVCGAITRASAGATTLAVAPSPLSEANTCAASLAVIASGSANGKAPVVEGGGE